MHLTTAITLSIPHIFQCSKLCWKAERKHYQAGTKSIESPLVGTFCMRQYAVAWAALSRMGRMVVNGCMELMGYMGLNGAAWASWAAWTA
eukprot:359747-Chlamydomonas_euryale.AAC.2